MILDNMQIKKEEGVYGINSDVGCLVYGQIVFRQRKLQPPKTPDACVLNIWNVYGLDKIV